MRKVIPYVIAAVLGLGGAFYLLRESPTAPAPDAGKAAVEKTPVRAAPSNGAEAPSEFQLGGAVDNRVTAAQAPPEGTLRPMNQAEIAQKTRAERPFNKRYDNVSAFWRILAKDLYASDKELAKQCGEMEMALRGRSNQDEVNVKETLDAEIALARKVRSAVGANADLLPLLTYIEKSAEAVQKGEDPMKVPRPSKENPNPF
jgi:hypothetical protein